MKNLSQKLKWQFHEYLGLFFFKYSLTAPWFVSDEIFVTYSRRYDDLARAMWNRFLNAKGIFKDVHKSLFFSNSFFRFCSKIYSDLSFRNRLTHITYTQQSQYECCAKSDDRSFYNFQIHLFRFEVFKTKNQFKDSWK